MGKAGQEEVGIDELKVIAAELVTQPRHDHRLATSRIGQGPDPCTGPPDLQVEATKLVLEQAAVLCEDWMG